MSWHSYVRFKLCTSTSTSIWVPTVLLSLLEVLKMQDPISGYQFDDKLHREELGVWDLPFFDMYIAIKKSNVGAVLRVFCRMWYWPELQFGDLKNFSSISLNTSFTCGSGLFFYGTNLRYCFKCGLQFCGGKISLAASTAVPTTDKISLLLDPT